MKFRCERDALAEVLTTTSRAVSNRSTSTPALSGVHLRVSNDHLYLTGTDLDLSIRTELTVSNAVDGAVVVPARLLADIVRSLPQGAVEFENTETEVVVRGGRSQFTVRTLNAEEFPRIEIPNDYSLQLPGDELKAVLTQVVRAASHDDARPVLTGVLMSAQDDGLRLVATDSYRLAVGDVPGVKVLQSGQSVLIPSRALGELNRILGKDSVEMALDEREVSFRVGDTSLVSRLIEGQFPDYQPLLPSNYPNRLTIDRDVLLDALRRVKLLVRDATTPVRMMLNDEMVGLSVVSQEVGQATEDIEAKYEGESMTVAFNPTYLIDGLESIKPGDVVLETVDALKPAIITPGTDDNKFLYLIMPVRVS